MKTIDPNKKIEVYFNLHKKIWSVRQSGKVVQHTNFIQIREPQYVVSQKGNERVRREKKKNVHAFVRGYVENRLPVFPRKSTFITYNPYKHKTFVDKKTGRTVKVSDYAVLTCGNGWRDVEGIWS